VSIADFEIDAGEKPRDDLGKVGFGAPVDTENDTEGGDAQALALVPHVATQAPAEGSWAEFNRKARMGVGEFATVPQLVAQVALLRQTMTPQVSLMNTLLNIAGGRWQQDCRTMH
jgi:hypothetical protein